MTTLSVELLHQGRLVGVQTQQLAASEMGITLAGLREMFGSDGRGAFSKVDGEWSKGKVIDALIIHADAREVQYCVNGTRRRAEAGSKPVPVPVHLHPEVVLRVHLEVNDSRR